MLERAPVSTGTVNQESLPRQHLPQGGDGHRQIGDLANSCSCKAGRTHADDDDRDTLDKDTLPDGLVCAVMLTRVLETLLFGVSALDPVTFLGVAILLLVAVLIACYAPARRAARVDPIAALRAE